MTRIKRDGGEGEAGEARHTRETNFQSQISKNKNEKNGGEGERIQTRGVKHTGSGVYTYVQSAVRQDYRTQGGKIEGDTTF